MIDTIAYRIGDLKVVMRDEPDFIESMEDTLHLMGGQSGDLDAIERGVIMVCIPFTDLQWTIIELNFRDYHKDDTRKKLPVREVAEWFSAWIMGKLQ